MSRNKSLARTQACKPPRDEGEEEMTVHNLFLKCYSHPEVLRDVMCLHLLALKKGDRLRILKQPENEPTNQPINQPTRRPTEWDEDF